MSPLFAAVVASVALFAVILPARSADVDVCADPGGCATSDHSLLQAKTNVHHAGMSMSNDADDCPHLLGFCKADKTGRARRFSALERKAKERFPKKDSLNTLLAFDCGSSGSSMEVVDASDACMALLKKHFKTEDDQTVKRKGLETQKAKGGASLGCTVSVAFGGAGPTPVGACASKWTALATWATDPQRNACFTSSICWAAGTAGNRLVSPATDFRGWDNFKNWALNQKLCNSWAAEHLVPSYRISTTSPTHKGDLTLTIPGTMEAAMEVEVLYDRERAQRCGTIAFGSAGGSSAQFGLQISCSKDPKAVKIAKKFVKTWAKTFQEANYDSHVDQLPGDYLNMYTKGSDVWMVGSFLGYDKCAKGSNPDPAPAYSTQLNTPMGGIGAMKCGYLRASGAIDKVDWNTPDAVDNEINKVKATKVEDTMAASSQGAFAKAFKELVNQLWPRDEKGKSPLTKGMKVRFVAKIWLALGIIGVKGNKLKEKDTNGFVKVGYAYMKTLGLLPSELGQTEAEEENFLKVNWNEDEENEYAWLETAASIGFGDRLMGTFGDDVTSSIQDPLR